jgi:hypothetical protein
MYDSRVADYASATPARESIDPCRGFLKGRCLISGAIDCAETRSGKPAAIRTRPLAAHDIVWMPVRKLHGAEEFKMGRRGLLNERMCVLLPLARERHTGSPTCIRRNSQRRSRARPSMIQSRGASPAKASFGEISQA